MRPICYVLVSLAALGLFPSKPGSAGAHAGQGRNADPTSLHVANVRLVAAGAFQPRWSPDGRRLVYTQKAKSGTDAWQLWSSDQRGLTKMMVATKGFSGAWSPDGRKIAFLSVESIYSYRLVVRDLTASRSLDLTALKSSPTGHFRLKWIGDTLLVLREEGMLPVTVSKVN